MNIITYELEHSTPPPLVNFCTSQQVMFVSYMNNISLLVGSDSLLRIFD